MTSQVALPELGGHAYMVEGKLFPSVTTALGACGLGPDFSHIDPAILGAAAERGRFVHDYAALVLSGKDAPACFEFPEEWAGYVQAFDEAAQALHLEPEYTEHQIASPRLRLAGRVDFVGTLDGLPWVLDYKTSGSYPEHALQTAAYWLILSDVLGRSPGRRGCLYLRRDGGWSLEEHTNWQDYSVVEACAVVANYRLDRERACG